MATAPDPTWRVTGQRETTAIGTNGDFTRGVEVSFQLASGTVATVFVPESQYTEAKVRELVEAKAAKLLAVETLAG